MSSRSPSRLASSWNLKDKCRVTNANLALLVTRHPLFATLHSLDAARLSFSSLAERSILVAV